MVRSETVFTAAHDSVRRGVFVVREAPYTARAEVELSAAPDVGRLRLRVELDTLRSSRQPCRQAFDDERHRPTSFYRRSVGHWMTTVEAVASELVCHAMVSRQTSWYT